MKTMKTFAILALAASLTVGTATSAFAAPPNWQPQPTPNFPNFPQPAPPPAPQSPSPAPSPPTDNHHHHGNGAAWGALAGGTLLGVVLSSAATQPQPAAQPTVVVVQQPKGDATAYEKELQDEIGRERAKVRALEAELEKLKAGK